MNNVEVTAGKLFKLCVKIRLSVGQCRSGEGKDGIVLGRGGLCIFHPLSKPHTQHHASFLRHLHNSAVRCLLNGNAEVKLAIE